VLEISLEAFLLANDQSGAKSNKTI
jgi:hypothetical protein